MKIKAYQICYSPETLASVPDGFHALDYTDNSRPDWREFWPIRQFLLNNRLDSDVFYGFFSPKFNQKTQLSFTDLHEFSSNTSSKHDLIGFSPFWDLGSIFLNVFEQGNFFHPGLIDVCQNFSNMHLNGLDLAQSVTTSLNSIFCNYFIAKSTFWEKWLYLGDLLFYEAEINNSPLSKSLNSLTTYGHQTLPMKVFVQERLVTMCLLLNNFSSISYNPFSLPSSTTPFNKFYDEAIQSDAFKIAFLETKNNIFINRFASIRNNIIHNINK